MGWMMGIEPTTTGATIRGSTTELHPPLPKQRIGFRRLTQPWASPMRTMLGTPSRTRTCNLRLRRPLLYPVELWAHGTSSNPSRQTLFLKFSFQIKELVGVEGFEPPTSCSQSRRATRLRYTPRRRRSPSMRGAFYRLSRDGQASSSTMPGPAALPARGGVRQSSHSRPCGLRCAHSAGMAVITRAPSSFPPGYGPLSFQSPAPSKRILNRWPRN